LYPFSTHNLGGGVNLPGTLHPAKATNKKRIAISFTILYLNFLQVI
jgi:hypothetical protein